MKKYMFLVLAAIGLAACTNDDLGGDNGPAHSGEIEESYIAINLSAAGGTRADDGSYLEGVEAERAVKTAHFFFFKDGVPFPVNVTNNTVTSPGGTINHLATTLGDESTDGMNNVSDIKNAVLLLSSYKGEYPNQIVAVLNWNPEPQHAYYLSELETAVNLATKYDSKDYFVMSNAVYATTDNKVMNATPLTENDIKTDKDAALAAPVKIYVERVAAKVTVTTSDGKDLINLNTPIEGAYTLSSLVTKDVYAKLLGWELHKDIAQSYLLKKIDPTWTVESIGFNWNDSPWYRSYWATSLPHPSDVTESFKMEYNSPYPAGFSTQYGFAIGKATSAGTSEEVAKSFTYIGENTNGTEKGITKVILKAQLVDSENKPLEIASWYGNKYIGEESLRTAVANTLKYTLFYKASNDTYVGIEPNDLQCVAGGTADAPEGVDANEVYFQLSTADGVGTNRTGGWYKLVNGEYKPVADDLNADVYSEAATNKFLKTLQPGILYKDGKTFYYVDIKHLGNGEGKVGDYGIVRNHIYNIIINSIKGYGSPIYIGNSNLITPDYPDTPDAEESFVSAQINILSWRLVNQEVNIQPN